MPPKGKKVAKRVRAAEATTSVASSGSVAEQSSRSRRSGSEGHSSGTKSQSSELEVMRAQLMRYQQRFGDLVDDPVEDVRSEETPARHEPIVEPRVRYPPPPPPPAYAPVEARAAYPPPPPQGQARMPVISYWDALRHMKDMGTEMFAGESSPLVADNWRRKLERNLDTARCPEDYRLDLAVQYLKDSALCWWEGVVAGAQGRYQLTWEDFRREFTKRYFPKEAMDKMENAFHDLCQGNRTIREYEMEFSQLRRFAGRHLEEQELIRRFLKGMRLELRNRCTMIDYSCLIDLVEKAATQEAGLAAEQKYLRGSSAKTPRGEDSQERTLEGAQGSGKAREVHKQVVCYNCGEPGHKTPQCRQPRSIHCFNCGERGHIAAYCQRPPRVEQEGARPPVGQVRDNLPPPPKCQAVRPRAFVMETLAGAERIAGMFSTLSVYPFPVLHGWDFACVIWFESCMYCLWR